MRTIKTRKSAQGIKVLYKSVDLSKRMKNAFIRTKERTIETRSSSPNEYTEDKVQDTAHDMANEAVHQLSHPIQKSRDSMNRAKSHFQEVKRLLPKARESTHDAKTAVKEAKQTLKIVRQQGRQTLREVRQNTKRGYRGIKSDPIIRDIPKLETPRSIRVRRFTVNRLGEKKSKVVKIHKPAKNGSAQRYVVQKSPPLRSSKLHHIPKSVRTNVRKSRLPGRKATRTSSSLTPVRSGRQPVIPKPTNIKNVLRKLIGKNPSSPASVKPDMLKNTPPKSSNASPLKPLNDGVKRSHDSLDKTFRTPVSNQAASKSISKTDKPTAKELKRTAKGTVKQAKKSVKTAERSAKQAVKTAKRTMKTTRKTAQTATKTVKIAERTARVAAKTAVHTAKAAAKAIVALVKATIAAVKGLIALIAAGGWAAVAVILVVCFIGLIAASVFGIFFSNQPDPISGGLTVNSVIAEINTEYTAEIDGIVAANPHDLLDMSGARAAWKDVLAVYTVKSVTDPTNPLEVSTMTEEKAVILREVFWAMNTINYTAETVEVIEDILNEDATPTGETVAVEKLVLRIEVSHMTPDEMAVLYEFTNSQTELLSELLKQDYYAQWNALLYGVSTIGDGTMLEIADTQIGNIGGEPYWSWYGFSSRVEWCACFVSWVAEQCGYLEAGIIPRFSLCETGLNWFKDNGQWQERGYTPSPGDIIFFNWDEYSDSDHVGIVERVEGEYVHTIEGNTSDSVARRSYRLDYVCIMGYGVTVYG